MTAPLVVVSVLLLALAGFVVGVFMNVSWLLLGGLFVAVAVFLGLVGINAIGATK